MDKRLDDMSKEQLLNLNYHLVMTEGLGCPEEKYRGKGHECFYCNECWQMAIKNKLKSNS